MEPTTTQAMAAAEPMTFDEIILQDMSSGPNVDLIGEKLGELADGIAEAVYLDDRWDVLPEDDDRFTEVDERGDAISTSTRAIVSAWIGEMIAAGRWQQLRDLAAAVDTDPEDEEDEEEDSEDEEE